MKVEHIKTVIENSEDFAVIFMAKNRVTKVEEIIMQVGNIYFAGTTPYLSSDSFNEDYILVSELGRLHEEGE